jgi:hypothetical protein
MPYGKDVKSEVFDDYFTSVTYPSGYPSTVPGFVPHLFHLPPILPNHTDFGINHHRLNHESF